MTVELTACVDTVVQHRLADMRAGWVVGDFLPAAYQTRAAEVAVKTVTAGTREPLHEQLVATEITVVVSGQVLLCDRLLEAGDVLVIPPRTPAAFLALTDATLVVVKTPSSPDDKRVLGS